MDAHHGAPPAGQQVVHVRGDSQTDLEDLFNAVMNPNKTASLPSAVPMRMRKLPDSFFRQPDPRSHSRQASSDGGVCGSLTPHHVRAHSSPASLPINSLPSPATGGVGTPILPDDMPLPLGWEMAKTPTGQCYFLNHQEQTTTWHDPRLSQLQTNAASHPASGPPPHAHTLANPAPTPLGNAGPDSGVLPEGWEKAATAEGEVYYINHLTKTTSWLDPLLAQKADHGNIVLTTQQRQDKGAQRRKHTDLPMSIRSQDAGGRNQLASTMEHEPPTPNLVPSLDLQNRPGSIEPVLNGAHSRNESTDSGLSVSSLPRTSEHLLNTVEHMDTGDSGVASTMGEDLMPSIQEALSSDLLIDMETVLSASHMEKDSLLTWL